METQLVAEFVSKTGSTPDDALSCLKTWGWDLKKALIDYNGKQNVHAFLLIQNNIIESITDTSTTEYFNGRTGLKVSIDTVDSANGTASSNKSSPHQLQLRKPSLSKLDAVDIIECMYRDDPILLIPLLLLLCEM